MVRKFFKLYIYIYEYLFWLSRPFHSAYKKSFNYIDIFADSFCLNSTALTNDLYIFSKQIISFQSSDGKLSFNYDPITDSYWSNRYHRILKASSSKGDIKYPWEIGRLQYLSSQVFKGKSSYMDVCQLMSDMDYIKKPGYGVQWKCAMDVAIRASTVCIYSDYYKNRLLPEEFYINSVDYILLNLEKYGEWRGNHYLCNLAGLIIVSLHLNGRKYDNVLSFALSELSIELDRQFLADGGNFEGSSAYHLFALDIISTIYLYLSNDESLHERLITPRGKIFTNLGYMNGGSPDSLSGIVLKLKEKMLLATKFALTLLNNQDEIVQIGDNDSGKFYPDFHCTKNSSTFLNVVKRSQSILAYNNITTDNKLASWQEESHLINNVADKVNLSEVTKMFTAASPESKLCHKFKMNDPTFPKSIYFHKEFGLIVIKGEDSYLSFRAGSIGQSGKGGHDHYDQLSITLYDSGVHILRDPGTYIYTSDLFSRNLYRSSQAHFGIMEVGNVDDFSNTFSIKSSCSEVIYFSESCIIAKQIVSDNLTKYRKININNQDLVIEDLVCGGLIQKNFIKLNYSPAYGVLNEQ